MDIKDVIRNKVNALKMAIGSRRVGVYLDSVDRFDRNMRSILDGIDVVGVFIPSEVSAANSHSQQQLAIAEAKLSQLKVLGGKLKRWKENSVNQQTNVSPDEVEQLKQSISDITIEVESIKTELSNGVTTFDENIGTRNCRIFTNIDEFFRNTDICFCWGKDGNFQALLNRAKTLFPQNSLIDLLDSQEINSLTGFVEERHDYLKLFRLTDKDEELLSEKGYNTEFLKKTAMNICKNSLQKRSEVGFAAIDSFEHEKQLLVESGFDGEVLGFERPIPYFLQSVLKTGYVFSRCPVCGKACRTNQSFCMFTHPYHQLIFYRFSCCKIFYLIVGDSRQRKIGMYIPQDELMINFIYYKNGGASEEPYSQQHYMEWVNDFKKHIIYSWCEVDLYIASPDKRNTCFTAFISNFGHHMTDEVAAIQNLYDNGDISNINTFFVGSYDHFNIPSLFPELPILNRNNDYSTNTIDVFKMALKNNCFGFRPFFDGPFQEELAQKIHQSAREKCSSQFLEIVDNSAKHHPLIWVTLRSHNRAWLSQKEGLANVLNKLYEDFPNLAVVFDGVPGEAQLMDGTKELLDPDITVFNGLNCGKDQTIVWSHKIDFYIAPHAAGTTFTTIANKPGVTHTHSKWAKNTPYLIARRENGMLSYPVPSARDEEGNDDDFVCNYEVDWKDVYNTVIEVVDILNKPKVQVVSNRRARVLLLSPLFDKVGELPPMGIAYLAGYFKDHSDIEMNIPYHPQYNGSIEDCVSDESYDIVSTGGMLTYMDFFKEFFNTALEKNPQSKRVIGGPVVSAFDKKILFDALPVDVAVYGEGEETFEELILALKDNRALDSVKGIIYRREDGRIVENPPRPLIDLKKNDLRPDWSFFEMEGYFKQHLNKMNEGRPWRRNLPVFSGRGCPNKCHFCHSPFGRYRSRPTEMVISEIKDYKQKYKLQTTGFRDETFASPRRMVEICNAMIDAKLDMEWACGLRTNLVTEESLRKMKEAGCFQIQLGLESGSEKILKRMNKNVTVEHHRRAVALSRKVGIRPMIAVMFGYIDETIEDLRETVDLLIELNELPEYLSHP